MRLGLSALGVPRHIHLMITKSSPARSRCKEIVPESSPLCDELGNDAKELVVFLAPYLSHSLRKPSDSIAHLWKAGDEDGRWKAIIKSERLLTI